MDGNLQKNRRSSFAICFSHCGEMFEAIGVNAEDIFAHLEVDFGIFKAIILYYKVVVMYCFFLFLPEKYLF